MADHHHTKKERAKRAGFKKDNSTPSAGTTVKKKKNVKRGKTKYQVIWKPTTVLKATLERNLLN